MHITIEPNACVLSVESDSIYARSIEHFINKNFKRVLAFTNTRLVFANKTESFMRDYFLQWAYQVYCKKNLPSDALRERLKAIQNIPIKIILTSKKSVSQKLQITVKLLEENRVILKTEQKNKQLCLYLRLRFGKAFLQILPEHKGIMIKISDKTALNRLKSLLSCSIIIGLPVQFLYSNGSVESIRIDEERSIIEDAFSVLRIQPGAQMREIKASYRRLLKQYHPDRVYMCDAKTVSSYTAQFQRIQNAFELIKQKSA